MPRVSAVVVMLLVFASAVCSAALPDDPALTKPVTLAVKGEALSDVLELMQDQTGIKLRADRDIADQKATIFVDKKPLKEVMNGLSIVFGYRWSQETLSGNKTYRLWEDEKTRRDREDQRQKAFAQAWEQANTVFGYMTEYAQVSPGELKQLPDKLQADDARKHDPDLQLKLQAAANLNTDPRSKPIADFYRTLPESIVNAIKSGMSVYYDSASPEPEWKLPEVLVSQLGDAQEIVSKHVGKPTLMMSGPDGKSVPFEPDDDMPLDGITLGYSATITNDKASLDAAIYSRYKSVTTIPASGQTPQGTSTRSKTTSRSVALADASVSVATEASASRLPHKQDATLAEMKVPFDVEDIVKETGIPASSIGTQTNRSDVLAILHRKLGLQIVSDHYSQWHSWIVEKSSSVEQLLSMFRQKSVGWGWDGDYCYLRNMDAAACDPRETPNRLIRGWQAKYSKNKCLELDELAQISMLTDEQINVLRTNSRYLGLGDRIVTARTFRLYGMLSAGQRANALGKGISIADMTPEQRIAVAEMMSTSNGQWQAPHGDAIVGIYKNGVRIDKPDQPSDGPNVATGVKMEISDVQTTYQLETKTPSATDTRTIQASSPEGAWQKVATEFPGEKKESLICVQQKVFTATVLREHGSPSFVTDFSVRVPYSEIEKVSGDKGN